MFDERANMEEESTNPAAPATAWRPPLVVLAGLGMGGEALGERARRWIDRAEVLAGAARHLKLFPDHPAEKLPFGSPLSETLKEVERVSRERRTVVFASGDPFFFGVGKRLVEILGKERILAIPNITTVQSLFAKLCEPWSDAYVGSLHGRENVGWLRAFRNYSRIALFTDDVHTPAWIATRLLDAGVRNYRLVVAEDLGLPTERIRHFSLDDACKETFSPLNLVAAFRTGPHHAEIGEGEEEAAAAAAGVPQPVLGLPEAAFRHQAGLITKMEIRVLILAHLKLMPDLVLWDLGAGSGSAAIEAARIAPLRKVIAVEKNAARFADLCENTIRFGCFEIETVHGAAPDALRGLPDPDRVFIGGCGGETERILSAVASRLRPHGRVVQAIVTLEGLEASRAFWRKTGFETDLVQIQVNRSTPIGEKSSRFEALNPVFILTAYRKHSSNLEGNA